MAEDSDGSHMDYFVVGAGNIVENSQKHAAAVPTGSLKYFWGTGLLLGGFSMVEVNSSQMTLSLVEHTQRTLYQAVLKPRV